MKKYKISKFSQYMGVSVDTIKHYQDCGILSPIIDPVNHYRYYNITHGERLIVSRKFRNLGFNINDTADLISCKNGLEIQEMLNIREKELATELEKLKLNYENVQYLSKLCHKFNKEVDTFIECTRPAYYFYRHTYEFSFIEENVQPSLSKALMQQLPNAVKMLIVPHSSIKSRKNVHYYHAIAIKECFSSLISASDLTTLEYIPERPAILYYYSRPHSHNKFEFIDDIYDQLVSKGYTLSTEDIIIENAIDYYEDNIRYENYLIYFSLS